MDLWAILVLGLVKQALGLECDRLHMLANSHVDFAGSSDIRDRRWCRLRTLAGNVNLPAPELLGKISRLVLEHAHAMAGKPPCRSCSGAAIRSWRNRRPPADGYEPSGDAVRSSLGRTARLAKVHKVSDWRKWKQRKQNVKALFDLVRSKKRETEKNAEEREAHLATCKSEAALIEKTIRGLRVAGVDCREIREVERFLGFANILSVQIRRRVLEGEKMPHEEKIWSIRDSGVIRWGQRSSPFPTSTRLLPVSAPCDEKGQRMRFFPWKYDKRGAKVQRPSPARSHFLLLVWVKRK